MGNLAATLLLLQQLSVTPFPAEVGQQVTIRVTERAGPAVGVAVEVELPDGGRRALGASGADGRLGFAPTAPGAYVFRAELDGVALVAPHRVVAERRRWLYGLCCVPVGLWLLWRHLRRR